MSDQMNDMRPEAAAAADSTASVVSADNTAAAAAAAATPEAAGIQGESAARPELPPEARPELLTRKGFRILRFEVYNWGQFHHQIWKLNFNLKNTLLIGNNGSGKSTLADALTTLLVPRREIIYNRAAGAKSKDRTLGSYVLGQVKNMSDGSESALRRNNEYAVILAVFYCEELQKHVTLAQFFSFKTGSEQPDTIYVTAEADLSIKEDFTAFGRTTNDLRRKLRKKYGDKINLFNEFAGYGMWFRQHLNVSRRALEIFNKSISLKDIPDINSFIRDFMLDAEDIGSMVDGLIDHFNDLTESHDKIKKARQQIEELTPINDHACRYQELQQLLDEIEQGKDSADSYIYKRHSVILQRRLEELKQQELLQQSKMDQYEQRRVELEQDREMLTARLIQSGGAEISNLEQLLQIKRHEEQRRAQTFMRFSQVADSLGESPAEDEEGFLKQKSRISNKLDSFKKEREAVQAEADDINFRGRTAQNKLKEIQSELDALQQSDSNIAGEQIRIRAQLADSIGVDEMELPYIGELIQIKKQDKKIWEGAIERVLHNFALSMLVPDELYKDVVSYVNTHHLGGRLVFYKSSAIDQERSRALQPNSLVHKLEVKPESRFHDALLAMLMQRFNYACCKSEEEFRRTPGDALLPSGLYKSKNRNEKDDRRRLDDRSRYVLGWSNADKKAVLQAEIDQLNRELDAARDNFVAHKKKVEATDRKIQAAEKLLHDFVSWQELDCQAVADELQELEQKIERLKHNPDIAEIKQELDQVKKQLDDTRDCKDKALTEHANIVSDERRFQGDLEIAEQHLAQYPLTAEVEQYLHDLYERLHLQNASFRLTVGNCPQIMQVFSSELEAMANTHRRQMRGLRDIVISGMQNYINHYREECNELSASEGCIKDFQDLLKSLRVDNLPKFEQQFKDKLKLSTLSNVAHFSAVLKKNSDNISKRIKEINNSLKGIDYNYESYIEIHKKAVVDPEIKQFRDDLNACLSNASIVSHEDELKFAEEKFELISNLIERFKGREKYLAEDEKWRRKVTDVRCWYEYAAMERRREDDAEIEYYNSANAKSGGQKEKLAYTILASALYYQILLQEKQGRPGTALRFIMIDEAFSSGSPNLAEYTLSLFRLMELQILVITPMTKIGVIEPFVQQIGYAEANQRTHISALRNFTVEHYKALFEAADDQKKKGQPAAAAPQGEPAAGAAASTVTAAADSSATADSSAADSTAAVDTSADNAADSTTTTTAAAVSEQAEPGTAEPKAVDVVEEKTPALSAQAVYIEAHPGLSASAASSASAAADSRQQSTAAEATARGREDGAGAHSNAADPDASASADTSASAAVADDPDAAGDEKTDLEHDPDVQAYRRRRKQQEQQEQQQKADGFDDLPLFKLLAGMGNDEQVDDTAAKQAQDADLRRRAQALEDPNTLLDELASAAPAAAVKPQLPAEEEAKESGNAQEAQKDREEQPADDTAAEDDDSLELDHSLDDNLADGRAAVEDDQDETGLSDNYDGSGSRGEPGQG